VGHFSLKIYNCGSFSWPSFTTQKLNVCWHARYASIYRLFKNNWLPITWNGTQTYIPQRNFVPTQYVQMLIIYKYQPFLLLCIQICSHHVPLELANHATQLMKNKWHFICFSSHAHGENLYISEATTNNRNASCHIDLQPEIGGAKSCRKLFSFKNTNIGWIWSWHMAHKHQLLEIKSRNG